MIDRILALFNAVHVEVPDATPEEISAVIRERPDATPGQLALAIYARRPDETYQCDVCGRQCSRIHCSVVCGTDTAACDDCAHYDWEAYDEAADSVLQAPGRFGVGSVGGTRSGS